MKTYTISNRYPCSYYNKYAPHSHCVSSEVFFCELVIGFFIICHSIEVINQHRWSVVKVLSDDTLLCGKYLDILVGVGAVLNRKLH